MGTGRCDARHARGRAAPGDEEALSHELAVGLDDHTACDAELGGQRARRRQSGPRVQPAGTHAVADLLLELHAQRARVGPIQRDEEVTAEVVHSIHQASARVAAAVAAAIATTTSTGARRARATSPAVRPTARASSVRWRPSANAWVTIRAASSVGASSVTTPIRGR